MSVSRDMLLDELRELQRLTAFEQAVATVRRAQAASTPIAQELAANAAQAGERLGLLGQAVRSLSGSPDVVTPLLGRLGAIVQAQLNQVQTLQGALLGDLALEHQLRERARYARTLAGTLGEASLVPVLDRLELAHTETISWLEARLAEVARTGTSSLRATPVQAAVGQVRRVTGAPFALTFAAVNRVGALVGRFGRQAPALAEQVAETAADVAGDAAGAASQTVSQVASQVASASEDLAETVVDTAVQTATAAADVAGDVAGGAADAAAGTAAAAVDRAGDVAQSAAGTAGDLAERAADTAAGALGEAGDLAERAADTAAGTLGEAGDRAQQAADASLAAPPAADPEAGDDPADEADRAEDETHRVLDLTGGDDVADAKAPFPGYERLTGDTVMRHVNDTEDVEELRTLLAFEQAHKARKGVLKAAQQRLSSLSGV